MDAQTHAFPTSRKKAPVKKFTLRPIAFEQDKQQRVSMYRMLRQTLPHARFFFILLLLFI